MGNFVNQDKSVEKPKRRFELSILISGDTWEDVKQELDRIYPHVLEHGPKCNSVSGSPSSGHVVDITERPKMTQERYIQDLEAYLAIVKGNQPTGCKYCKQEFLNRTAYWKHNCDHGPLRSPGE